MLSLPDVFPNRVSEDINAEYQGKKEHDRLRTEPGFFEKNTQIRELSTFFRILSEQVTNSRTISERSTPTIRLEIARNAAAPIALCVSDSYQKLNMFLQSQTNMRVKVR